MNKEPVENQTPFRAELTALADSSYRDFQARLMPTVDKKMILGVRMPALRKLAKSLKNSPDREAFLNSLPHAYYDENNLHALFLNEMEGFAAALAAVKAFLPFVDNWATCDLLNPKAFRGQQERLYPEIKGFLTSGHTYTVRFGLGLLMRHFLKEAFTKESMALAVSACCEDYYVNMAVAWYMATALDQQPEAALEVLEGERLSLWVHNRSIRKGLESFRLSPECRERIRNLRRSERKS